MRSGGEGRPSWDSNWQEDMLKEMLEVEGGQGDHQRLSGATQMDGVRNRQAPRSAIEPDAKGLSLQFYLGLGCQKYLSQIGCLLIKRMYPVLLERCRACPATWGSAWTLCGEAFPRDSSSLPVSSSALSVLGWAGQAAVLPPNAPPQHRHRAKEENFTPLPVLASLLPSKCGELLPPLSSSTFQCKDLANFFYE